MAPKKSASGAGGTSIAKAVGGRGAKNASTGSAALLGKGKGSLSKSGSAAAPIKTQESTPTPTVYTKEQLALAEGKPDLDPNSPSYNALWEDVKSKMGMPKNAPIHSQHMNRIEHILRVFDLDPSYGPALGMTRLERWQRAEKLGDEPPWEIKEILETKQGILDLQESVLADKGV